MRHRALEPSHISSRCILLPPATPNPGPNYTGPTLAAKCFRFKVTAVRTTGYDLQMSEVQVLDGYGNRIGGGVMAQTIGASNPTSHAMHGMGRTPSYPGACFEWLWLHP